MNPPEKFKILDLNNFNDAASVSSSSSSTKLTKIPWCQADGIMVTNVKYLKSDRTPVEKMIDIDSNVPEELLRETFYELSKTFTTHLLSNEASKSTAVDKVLETVLFHVIRKYNLDRNYQLTIEKEDELKYLFKDVKVKNDAEAVESWNILVKGRLDFEILARSQIDSKPVSCLIVEAKSNQPIDGLIQAGVSMKRRENLQNSKKPLFGLLSNGTDWTAVSLRNGQFQVSNDYRIRDEEENMTFIPADEMFARAEAWIKNKRLSLLPRFLYSVLCQSFELAFSDDIKERASKRLKRTKSSVGGETKAWPAF